MSDPSSVKKIFDYKLLRRILSIARPYQKKIYLSLFLSIILAVMAPIRPWLIQFTIHSGIQNHDHAFLLRGPGMFIVEITLLQILLLMLDTLLRFIFTVTTSSLGQFVVRDLRISTFKKVLSLNLRQFDQTPIGTLTTRTVNDIESVNDIFSDGLIPIIADLLAIISVVGYMCFIDWKLALICLTPFPLMLLATYVFKESVNKSFIQVRNAVARLNGFVQEHLSGMYIIQAFTAEEREQKKFNEINKEHKDANIKAIFAYSVFFPLVELFSAFSIGLLVWWASSEASATDPSLNAEIAGKVTAFILCLNLLFRPLRVIADKFNVLQMGMIASERVFKVLDNADTTSNVEVMDNPSESKRIKGKIEFKDVSFSYGTKPVLNKISFSLASGKTLAIVGQTGSGKSTLVSLINRLYQHSEGKILIDDADITTMDLFTLRRQIAVVLQDVFLFSGSIMENITLRDMAIEKNKVIEAAKSIGLHDYIMQLPGGYDYEVLERGASLSSGQRQMISFVRAILFDPSILILDEATSSVDTETEQLLQKALAELVKGRTTLVIAHRLSTIRKADEILYLKDGNLLEIGTHDELMAKKQAYYQLFIKQFGAGGLGL
jgi:ATP-binding cassette subfamily B protein